MERKDPKDMTVSELLRWVANGEADESGNVVVHRKLLSALSGKEYDDSTATEDARNIRAIADKIDGEPVRLGCAVCGGIVGGFSVWDDGAFTTYDKDGNVLQDGDPGDFVKRPESKALDVDGVETKAGDTVWLHDKVDGGPVGEPMKVAEVLCDGTLVFEGGGAMPARLVTHREPDSLEKLRDDMREAMESSPDAMFMDSRWVDRLTALMERGER